MYLCEYLEPIGETVIRIKQMEFLIRSAKNLKHFNTLEQFNWRLNSQKRLKMKAGFRDFSPFLRIQAPIKLFQSIKMFRIFRGADQEFYLLYPDNRLSDRLQIFAEIHHFSFFFPEILKYGIHRKRAS